MSTGIFQYTEEKFSIVPHVCTVFLPSTLQAPYIKTSKTRSVQTKRIYLQTQAFTLATHFHLIYGVIKAICTLYMHVHTNDAVISQSNSIANNKSLPPMIYETIPGCVQSFWTYQQGLFCHHQKPKPHICNNMKIVVSFYYKFL